MENNSCTPNKKEDSFKSRFGTIMAVVGFTVGLGALWGTPMYIANNGGGIAILLVVFLSIVIAIPLTTFEMSLGRASRETILTGIDKIAGKGSKYNILGWVGVVANLLLTCTFVILCGVTFAYVFMAFGGQLSGKSAEEYAGMYNGLLTNIPVMLALCALMAGSFIFVIKQGVQKGLERVCKFMVPILLGMLLLMAGWNIFLPGGLEGLIWFFKPDFSVLTLEMFGGAMWTVFLLAPIGYTAAFAFGSYMPEKDSDLVGTATVIVLSDTTVGILVGLSIFPAMFAAGLDPASIGQSSFFGGIPLTFDTLPGGRFLVPVFFILAFFALYTTGLGLAEGSIATLKDFYCWSRLKAATIVNVILFALAGLIVILNGMGLTARGLDPLSFVQYFVMLQLVPISGLLLVIFLIKFYKFDRYKEEVNLGTGAYKVAGWWKALYYVVIPLVILYTFYFGMTIFYL
jgi:NSS family neurotransmitter:Na+ symporter